MSKLKLDYNIDSRGEQLCHMPVGLPEVEKQERIDAETYVRRLANRHECKDGKAENCTEPFAHAMDASDIGPALKALGLL